jgi:hypothetical protein
MTSFLAGTPRTLVQRSYGKAANHEPIDQVIGDALNILFVALAVNGRESGSARQILAPESKRSAEVSGKPGEARTGEAETRRAEGVGIPLTSFIVAQENRRGL